MIAKVEIGTKQQFSDPLREKIKKSIKDLGISSINEVTSFKIFYLRGNFTEEDKDKIYQLGENFHLVWGNESCKPSIKKKIIRIIINEIIVDLTVLI